jgi:Ca2+-transporting ATPase
MKQYFNQSVAETAKALEVDLAQGLLGSEAQKRIQQYGPNRLEGGKGKSLLQMALEQLKDFLVVILVIAAVISIFLGESLEGIVILSIVVLNTILGVYQENKASNALKALKEMASPHAKVLRDGRVAEIASHEVVPGDVVMLEAGDYIPADLRLAESVNLKIDEAALTGESVPVEKDAAALVSDDQSLGDRINCAYMGTIITYGRGKGIITQTGMKTQMGSIAGILGESQDETTPLQKKLDSLGKLLGIVCLGICGIIFLLGLLRGMELFDIFMTSVSLAVAAIPEGLTVVVTVILAMGMQRMVKCNAIIKRLSAVETLGSTTVICSDKTGTLTQNKMTIQRLYDGWQMYSVSGTGYSPTGDIVDASGSVQHDMRRFLECILLCNDAAYDPEKEAIIGDPTEGAMVVLAHKAGMEKAEWDEKHPRLQEIPFDSARKLMSTFHQIGGQTVMYVKGAPDVLMSRCTAIEQDGKAQPMTDEKRRDILLANQRFAESALRVIGGAYRVVDRVDTAFESENDLTFLGLAGMIDPPRAEAKEAIGICKKAGIQVKMITGDHKLTAAAIGRELGIAQGESAVEGREISDMSDDELKARVKDSNVFARVSPEHKVRLVDAVRANGDIAAMTGDGVNDAPSLKRADIGIAMGITGTDVSKEAADMILTDDNFASIVRAVSEGRTIYGNIRKVVGYLLSCNIGEILVIFLAMLANLPVPLVAIQLLSINLITDAFPAFALGMEKEEPGVMERAPRDPAEPIVDKKMSVAVAIQSIALALGTLGSFVYGLYVHKDLEVARTACFLTLVLGELLRAYSSRSEQISVFKMRVFDNSYLNKCVLASLIFMLASIYVPALNPIFSTVPLTFDEMIVSLLLAFVPMLGGELAKRVVGRAPAE